MSDTLMISVSGMRGLVGTDLTPELVSRHAAALGAWVRGNGATCVVLGRDARTSGEMFARAATAGFQSVGVDVIDVGVAPTPTVQMAVEHHHAGAGLILTASHNPIEWNALKFVGPDGIFLNAEAGAAVRRFADAGPARADWSTIGSCSEDHGAIARHLDAILALPIVDVAAIRNRGFHVALDCVRGAGGPTMLALFDRLGVRVSGINLEADGRFPREPEPIPENLGGLAELVQQSGADIGMAVDPDVDRLALVDEAGRPIGEDYTLAVAARAVLAAAGRGAGAAPVVVANLSTSLVVADAVAAGGGRFVRAPVGEANVARVIVEERALLGGEGNGGVILPALHVGRDAPLGAALILQHLALTGQRLSAVVAGAPRYVIVKAKAGRGGDLEALYRRLEAAFPEAECDRRDGLRLGWPDRWLHVRPSGTEPIVRLIAEAPTREEAEALVRTARG
jgi:phosphomannomutase